MILFLLWVYLVFDPLGSSPGRKSHTLTTQQSKTLWRNRFKVIFFFFGA